MEILLYIWNVEFLNTQIMEKEYTPETIEDCMVILDEIITEEDKTEIKNMSEFDFKMSAHFGLGVWIRNNFGAWQEDAPLVKNTGLVGDSLSAKVLENYHAHLMKKA